MKREVTIMVEGKRIHDKVGYVEYCKRLGIATGGSETAGRRGIRKFTYPDELQVRERININSLGSNAPASSRNDRNPLKG